MKSFAFQQMLDSLAEVDPIPKRLISFALSTCRSNNVCNLKSYMLATIDADLLALKSVVQITDKSQYSSLSTNLAIDRTGIKYDLFESSFANQYELQETDLINSVYQTTSIKAQDVRQITMIQDPDECSMWLLTQPIQSKHSNHERQVVLDESDYLDLDQPQLKSQASVEMQTTSLYQIKHTQCSPVEKIKNQAYKTPKPKTVTM